MRGGCATLPRALRAGSSAGGRALRFATGGRFTERFWIGVGMGRSPPPPGSRLGTGGVLGARRESALASSGIFPAGQEHRC